MKVSPNEIPMPTSEIFLLLSSSCLLTKREWQPVARVSQQEKLCTQQCWAFKFPRWAAQKSLNLWIWSTSSLVSADPGKCWVTFTWQSWRYGLLMAQWQWLMFSTFDIFTLAQVARRCLIGDVFSIRKNNSCVMMEVDSASELGFQHAQHHLQNGETDAVVAIAKQNVFCKSQTFTKFLND